MARPQLTEEEKRLFEAFLMPKVADPNKVGSSFDVRESTSPSAARGGFASQDIGSVTGPNDFAPYGAEQTPEPAPQVPMLPEPMPEESIDLMPAPAPKVAPALAPAAKKIPNDSDIIKSFMAMAETPAPVERYNPMETIGQAVSGFGDALAARGGGKGGALDRTLGLQKEARAESKEKAALRENSDPASAKSRAYQALMKEMFPDMDVSKLSAAQAEKVMGPLGQIVEKREARRTAEESRKERQALAEATRNNTVNQKTEDRTQAMRKEVMGSKSYQGWLDIKNASDNLQNAAANPTGKRTLGALYSYVKALDPGSVVREGEIALAGEARSVAQRLEGMFRKMSSGSVLTPGEVRELAAWSKEKEQLARQTATASNQPTIAQAQRLGISLDEINQDLFGEPAKGAGTISDDVRQGAAAALAARRGKKG